MNPEFVIYLTLVAGCLIGFVVGRWEKQDSFTKGYKRGKLVGEAVAKNER